MIFLGYRPVAILSAQAVLCLAAATGRWMMLAALVALGAGLAALPALAGRGATLLDRLATRESPAQRVRAGGGSGLSPRTLEWRLLVGLIPLATTGAVAVAAPITPGEAFPGALIHAAEPVALVLGTAAAVHLAFRIARFDGDGAILPLATALLLVGVLYHAGVAPPGGDSAALNHFVCGAIGALIAIAAVVLLVPLYRRLTFWVEEKVWWPVVGAIPYYESLPFLLALAVVMGGLVLLLLVRGRPEGIAGAIIRAPLPGGGSFTPSEFVRLAMAFFLADYLGRNSRILRNLRQPIARVWPLSLLSVEHAVSLGVMLGVVALYCLFFFVFRDYGPAVILYAQAVLCLAAATGRWLTPAALVVLGAGLAALPALAGRGGTLLDRLTMWWNPWDTHFANGDHQARVLWSIVSGGWTGMPRTAEISRHLPEAESDAAFAGLVARYGLWVGLALLLFYVALAMRGLRIARAASDDRARLLAFSLTLLLTLQVVWICGAMVNALPLSGINLPFVSTGISNALACAIAVGTLLNLSRPTRPANLVRATPEVERGVRRLSVPVLASYGVPIAGLLLLAPPLLGDRLLVRSARALGSDGERYSFRNPYLQAWLQSQPRGRLYSADGELLAVSHPTEEDYRRIAESAPDFLPTLRRLAAAGRRAYPLGQDAAQLVGWMGAERYYDRPASLEVACEGLLRGYRDRDLPFLFRSRLNPFAPKPHPVDVETTISARLQRRASELLHEAVRRAGSTTGGAVLLLEAETGHVLAAATAPTFDPNELTADRMRRYLREHRRTGILANKALDPEARAFPGSTFKLLTLAAALAAMPEGTIECTGSNRQPIRWRLGSQQRYRPAGRIGDSGRHGRLDLAADYRHALAVSCNVYFATLAAAIGAERLHDQIARAEFGGAADVRRLGEYLPEAGFGQVVVRCSPIELARFVAAIARAGEETSRPHWIEAILDGGERRPATDAIGTTDDRPYRPLRPEVAAAVREAMIYAVNSPAGTAWAAFHPGGLPAWSGVTIGGKTGTAEFDRPASDPRRRRSARGRHAWFVGFARSDFAVEPRTLVIVVLLEDVARGGTGGAICAPLARELFRAALQPPAPPLPPVAPQVPLRPSWRDWFEGWRRWIPWRR